MSEPRSTTTGAARRMLPLLVAAVIAVPTPAAAQTILADSLVAGVPRAEQGGGTFFDQRLGTLLRLRYNTVSYGQAEGNVDIGSMKVFNFDQSTIFIDGQVTLNDISGTGFNVGVGGRWLHDSLLPVDAERILGVNFFTDGSSTQNDNFFPQLGVGIESLGDLWDFRANGYFPIGTRRKAEPTAATGMVAGYAGNFLLHQSRLSSEHALTVSDFEVARRLLDRDAWAFVGGYTLGGGGIETVGYKVGFRGNALPDLAVQLAVVDDDVFHTNVVFGLTWFIGRTSASYAPSCTVRDRFREPVIRNDYVTIQRSLVVLNDPLTDLDGQPIRLVHVDSAAVGGDGTFESPASTLAAAGAVGQDGDIILVHGGTSYANDSVQLLDNQQLLGEGDDVTFMVETSELGPIPLPETSAGARSLARPSVNNAGAIDAVTLADSNEVANLNFNGGARAIVAGGGGAGDPNLNRLQISSTTGDGMRLTPLVRTDGAGEQTVAFDVEISDVEFANVGGDDISIDADPGVLADPGPDINETINVSNITSTGGGGVGFLLENTTAGESATISDFSHTGGASGMRFASNDGSLTVTAATLADGSGNGLDFQNNTGMIVVDATSSVSNFDGTGVNVSGGSANMTLSMPVTNNTGSRGNSVVVNGVTDGFVTFFINADITDTTGDGIVIDGNSGGVMSFLGNMTIDVTGTNAISLTNNTGADIDLNGTLDLTTSGGDGLVASGGGTLRIFGAGNTINTTNGVGLNLSGITLGGGSGTIDSVSASGGSSGIIISELTGGALNVGIVGSSDGDGGTITGTTSAGITVTNAANVTFNSVDINAAGTQGALLVHNSDADSVVTMNNVNISGSTLAGISTIASGTGDTFIVVDRSQLSTIGAAGVDVTRTNTGDTSLSVNSSNISGTTGQAVTASASGSGELSVSLDTMLIDSVGAEGVVFNHGDTGNSSLSVRNIVLTDTTLAGVAAFATGSGEFDVALDTSTVDTMADVTGVTLNGGANANRIGVTLDTLNVTTGDAKALELLFDLNAGGADQVRVLADGSSFTNNTTADALPTAEFDVQGATSFNATVLDSTFTNSGSAGTNNRQFRIDGDGANVAVRLDLNGSAPNGLPNTSNGNFALNQINGTFSLVDRDDTLNDVNNTGNVDETGTIAVDPGNLPLP